MKTICIAILAMILSLSLTKDKKNSVFEVSPESTETQSVLDIKNLFHVLVPLKIFLILTIL